MENLEARVQAKVELPKVEAASWPKEFSNPNAAADNFTQTLKKMGVEV